MQRLRLEARARTKKKAHVRNIDCPLGSDFAAEQAI